jgi:hypothetical protein
MKYVFYFYSNRELFSLSEPIKSTFILSLSDSLKEGDAGCCSRRGSSRLYSNLVEWTDRFLADYSL